jgi:hypothetical protein
MHWRALIFSAITDLLCNYQGIPMRNPTTHFLCSSSLLVLLAVAPLAAAPALAQTVACEPPVVVDRAPPPLPVYSQPPVPGPGYVWTPGSWHWDSDEEDYYWVPGTWVEPPRQGLLWTPGYWGWAGGSYLYHHGYWAPHVGFYGGVAYGYGYTGEGYEGGRWEHGTFYYNRAVNNISNTRITNVYEKTVVMDHNAERASFNGGKGGVQARPTAQQKAIAKEQHFAATPPQQHHVEAASKDKILFDKNNHGKPAIAATPRPGVLTPGTQGKPTGATEGEKPVGGNKPAGVNPEKKSGAPMGHAATPESTTSGQAAGTHGKPAGKPRAPSGTPTTPGGKPGAATSGEKPVGGIRNGHEGKPAHSATPAAHGPQGAGEHAPREHGPMAHQPAAAGHPEHAPAAHPQGGPVEHSQHGPAPHAAAPAGHPEHGPAGHPEHAHPEGGAAAHGPGGHPQNGPEKDKHEPR